VNEQHIKRVHARLPTNWISQDEVEKLVREALGIREGDGATLGAALSLLGAVGALEARWTGPELQRKVLEYRRGELSEQGDPGRAFLEAENRRLAQEAERKQRTEANRRVNADALNTVPRQLQVREVEGIIGEYLVRLGRVTEAEAEAARTPKPQIAEFNTIAVG